MRFCCNGLGWGRMGGWPGFGLLGLVFGAVLLVGVLALLTLGAVWLARRSSVSGTGLPDGREDPLDVARHRLAAGDITSTEFEEIRARLGDGG